MPRRGENIRKRKDGRWEGRCIAGRTPEGKPLYKSLYGRSYAEVKEKRKMNPVAEPKKAEVMFSLQGIPVKMICAEWLEEIRIQVKPSTYGRYHDIVHTHILLYFQSMGADQLTSDTVNAFIRDKFDSGLSAKTTHDIALLLLQIVELGERKKYLDTFDYNSICLPKVQKKQVPVLSTADENRLIPFCLAFFGIS